MSGYKPEFPNFGAGTGPMQVNKEHLELAHKLKHCKPCDRDREPAGGTQVNDQTFVCASCWPAYFLSKRKRLKTKVAA